MSMSKKLIISIVVTILVVGGVVFTATNKGEMNSVDNKPVADTTHAETAAESTPKTNKETQKESSSQAETIAKGAYVDYSDSVIANTKGTKILFFHAPWCPQCRALESSIQSEGVPDGVTIIKVDYDSNQALRKKYGVTIQTTLVKVDDSGNKVKLYVAYDEPSLESVKANLL